MSARRQRAARYAANASSSCHCCGCWAGILRRPLSYPLAPLAALSPPPKIARTMSSSGIDSYNPPDNFALVSGMVYRSSFPKPDNFSYLKKLGLKTIL